MTKKTTSAKSNKASNGNASKIFDDVLSNSKQGFETLFSGKGVEEFTSFGQQNLDAVVESTTALASGCQEIGSNLMALAQQNLETSLSMTKELMGCKTLQEALELQSTYAKSLIESTLSEGSKLQEMSMRVANEAFEPVRDRVSSTYETILKGAAA